MCLARYRKYKAASELEGVSNYQGKGRQLWQYAAQSILEEEVAWGLEKEEGVCSGATEAEELESGAHQGPPGQVQGVQGPLQVLASPTSYILCCSRDKILLHPKKESVIEERLAELEKILDAFNINFNRERAKLLADADKLQVSILILPGK